MKYFSTNRHLAGGYTQTHTFSEALLMGIAPDAGLFMPETLPHFSAQQLQAMRGKTYAQIAAEVLFPFVEGQMSKEDLTAITTDAYGFDIPLENIDKNFWVARLDQGATASFKDFAARFMARATRYFLPKQQKLTVLVATSGDTGSAIGAAFQGIEGVKVYILYPQREVSFVQEQQLIRIGGNVQALAINGKFDDCQNLVKQAFADKELTELNLSSANSINVGRVLPQAVYYFYLWQKLTESMDEAINFVVPSGNLGNSLGAELARRMGLPVERLVIATNANRAVPDFLKNGVYEKISPSVAAVSNAMNVGNPSNLARYFALYGGTLDKDGQTHQAPDVAQMREHLLSVAISDTETIETIKYFYKKYACVLEPHGAVGAAAYRKLQSTLEKRKTILLETAHPAKFPEIVMQELGFAPPVPKALQAFLQNPASKIELTNDYKSLKNILLS